MCRKRNFRWPRDTRAGLVPVAIANAMHFDSIWERAGAPYPSCLQAHPSSDHKIKPPEPSITGLLDIEEQCLVKQSVSSVSGLGGKIELGGEDAPTRALYPKMKMTGSAGIKRRHDGVEPPSTLCVAELVSAQAETNAIVVAIFVRMPNLDESTAEGPAASVEYEPCDGYPFAVG